MAPLRCALLLGLACGARAACENVTWEPKAAVSFAAHRRVHELIEHLKHRDSIATLIADVREDVFREHVLYLSGEGSGSKITTRSSRSHKLSNAIDDALAYVRSKMEGYGFSTEVHSFREGFGLNLVSTIRGSKYPNEIVVMGAHLDDRRADINSLDRAPGGNDDGSGSAALLAIAEAIHRTKASFERTLVLEHYAGEEQGLLGSRALSAERRHRDEHVVAMFQQDMTAVIREGDKMGVALVQDSRAVDRELTEYAEKVAQLYADPRLTIFHTVLSGSNCCSDHQSYAENGFPSVGYIEPRGYTGDPQYHTVTDTVLREDYSSLQAVLAARVAFAAAADAAELREVRGSGNATRA
eukprot:TRINITY_DN20520_c0_g1_i1.p1 TRINITY_DN20520_c0_g1~~TRINITY_DN20520_c0_g1_i1.p1  ORF type:complete len:355 (+),score=124.21 TRINITY_DN20520_c0_g1_i1:61-1125(+)